MATMKTAPKRLLILGGQKKLCDIVKKAKQLGYETVATDWYADSPAKRIADKAYDISTADEDALLQLVKDERINGIYTGFIDSNLVHYIRVCERAGLPCYLNEEILRCGTNKQYFKDRCRTYGIETIPGYTVTSGNLEKSIARFEYPVLLKPVDNSGSKGITVCSDEWSFRRAYDRAMRFSKRKEVLVERFMCCDYIAAYYVVRNGQCQLSMLMDKDMNRIGRGTVPYPTAFVSPSIYYDRYVETIDPQVRRMMQDMGFTNGTFLISFFVNGHHFYAVELTSRLAATREYEFIEHRTGVDILAEQIAYAVGDPVPDTVLPALDRQMNENVNCMLFIFVKEGIIGKVRGISELRQMRGVLNVLQLREEGDTIKADGSYGQLFARIYLSTEDQQSMIDLVNAIQRTLAVTSVEGYPQLIDGFVADSFFRYT